GFYRHEVVSYRVVHATRSVLGPGKMPAGDVAEGHDRPEGDACARVAATHDAGPVVACRVQAGDRLASFVQHLPGRGGLDSVEGAQVAHQDLQGVVGAFANGCHAGIGFVFRIGEVAVEGGRSAAK